jgi:hypothetical protein
MQCTLRYSETIHTPVAAALINSASPAVWLQEIDRWGIEPSALECYIVPESIRSQVAAALLVVFRNPAIAATLTLQAPCYLVAGKIVLPQHTVLYPAATTAELQTVFVWELQLFHPRYGLVGFEKTDAINLAALLHDAAAITADWSFAHPGLPAKPGLQSITLLKPKADDLLAELKEAIQPKPLSEIPGAKDAPRTALDKITDQVKSGLFKSLLGLTNGISKMLPEAPAGTDGKEGMLPRLQQWLQKNIEDLERKRRNELRRLLDLFESDSDEALQYALPLDSPYLNRGGNSNASSLTRTTTNFNLGKLGGGTASSVWDAGDYYHDLRARYIKAAQQAIEKGDYRKAAYVYAHLLSDFHSAANVLEQGGYYREAAILYNEHLKNPAAAAQCLERGALYTEAIDIYLQLNSHEPAADLYRRIGQETKAVQQYEQCIDKSLRADDYIDAARIVQEKLCETERAEALLLQGWRDSQQAEQCIKQYFDTGYADEEALRIKKLKNIYHSQLPAYRQMAFFNTLEHINQQYGSAAMTELTRGMAFEIANAQIEKGNHNVLHNLKKFMPGDKLAASDCSRYATQLLQQKSRNTKRTLPDLDNNTLWTKAIWHHGVVLALGIKDDLLQLARYNYYGNTEYYSWNIRTDETDHFYFSGSPYASHDLFIYTPEQLLLSNKTLPRNKYFPSQITLRDITRLSQPGLQFAINHQQQLVALQINEKGPATLHYYDFDGKLLRSVNCVSKGQEIMLQAHAAPDALLFRNSLYYSYSGANLLMVQQNGNMKVYNTGSKIYDIAAPEGDEVNWLLVCAEDDTCLCRLDEKGGIASATKLPIVFTPLSTYFIQRNIFVLADTKQVQVYMITDDIPAPVTVFDTTEPIAAVLPGQQYGEVILLTQDGKFHICRYLANN